MLHAIGARVARQLRGRDADDEQHAELQQLQAALDQATRRADGLFAACQKFEAQRDEWNALYRRQAMEHGAAQALLERRIASLEAERNTLFKIANDERASAGKNPLGPLTSLPIDYGLAEAFLRRHLDLFEEARARFGLAAVERPAAKNNKRTAAEIGKNWEPKDIAQEIAPMGKEKS